MGLFPDAIGAGGLLRPGLRKVKERVWEGYGDFTWKVLQYGEVMGELRGRLRGEVTGEVTMTGFGEGIVRGYRL